MEPTDDRVQIDGRGEFVTIYGIRYAMSLFKEFGSGPLGSSFRIIRRGDGVVDLQSLAPGSIVPAVES